MNDTNAKTSIARMVRGGKIIDFNTPAGKAWLDGEINKRLQKKPGAHKKPTLTELQQLRKQFGPPLRAEIAKAVEKAFFNKAIGIINDPEVNPEFSKSVVVTKAGEIVTGTDGKKINGPPIHVNTTSDNFPYAEFIEFLRDPDIENEIPHFYLDSLGKITIGIGHLVPSLQDARALNLFLVDPASEGGAPQAPQQGQAGLDAIIEEEWKFLKSFSDEGTDAQKSQKGRARPPGHAALRPLLRLRMSEAQMSELAMNDVEETVRRLRRILVEFGSFPPAIQMGIADVAFNVGLRGFKAFEKMIAAIKCRDWETAGKENHPDDPAAPKARNDNRAKIVEQRFFAPVVRTKRFHRKCIHKTPAPVVPLLKLLKL